MNHSEAAGWQPGDQLDAALMVRLLLGRGSHRSGLVSPAWSISGGLSNRAGPGAAPPQAGRVVWTLSPPGGAGGALGMGVVSAVQQEERRGVCVCAHLSVYDSVIVCQYFLCSCV